MMTSPGLPLVTAASVTLQSVLKDGLLRGVMLDHVAKDQLTSPDCWK